jgi:DNA-binding NarL/FixJ family response regulator
MADMLAHYLLGDAVSPNELVKVSAKVGLEPAQLRTVMYDLPLPTLAGRPRQIEPCPMSTREVEVLRLLAKGMVYKQIATAMNLSTSTVRTHLHNVYKKVGAMDRAQAVLIATERGWI